jgi:hypothetical protein
MAFVEPRTYKRSHTLFVDFLVSGALGWLEDGFGFNVVLGCSNAKVDATDIYCIYIYIYNIR